jgi:FG-GAP-like repeat
MKIDRTGLGFWLPSAAALRLAAPMVAATVALAACGGGGGDPDPLPAFDSSGAVAVDDLDGDGLDDIAVTVSHIDGPPPHAGSVKVWLQRRDRPGTFGPATTYAVGPDPWQMHIADVDGDGVPDLIVMSSHASAVAGAPLVDVVTVLRGDAAQRGQFLPGPTLHAGARLADIGVADFDADGLADIAFTSYHDGARIAVWWNDRAAPGQFSSATTVVATAAGSLTVADLDGDHRADLAAVVGNDVELLRRDPNATRAFLPAVTIASGSYPSCVLATDLDDDGLPDLVLGSRETRDVGAPGELVTLRNDATQPLRFVELQRLPLVVHAGACVAARVDDDAAIDIVTTGAGVGGDLLDDVIEASLSDPAQPGLLLSAVRTVTNDTASGFHLALGTLDADARADAAMPYDGGVLILRQDPLRPGVFVRTLALR